MSSAVARGNGEKRERDGHRGAMECAESSQQEDGSTARPKSDRSPGRDEPDPRGFHELAFLGQSNACEAEPELEERDIGPEFDSYEDLDGDKLRLLDRWVGCEVGLCFFSRGVGGWDCGARFLFPRVPFAIFPPVLFFAGWEVEQVGRRGTERVSVGGGWLDRDLRVRGALNDTKGLRCSSCACCFIYWARSNCLGVTRLKLHTYVCRHDRLSMCPRALPLHFFLLSPPVYCMHMT